MHESLERKYFWRHVLVMSLALPFVALPACTPQPMNRSPESEFLQNQVVPAMNEWSVSGSAVMHLYKSPTIRSFDYLCAVPEYQRHSRIEEELPEVNEYMGATGDIVPEMRVALIGVKKNTAHVSYIKLNPLTIYGINSKCHAADRVVLRRRVKTGTGLPQASLEAQQ